LKFSPASSNHSVTINPGQDFYAFVPESQMLSNSIINEAPSIVCEPSAAKIQYYYTAGNTFVPYKQSASNTN